MERAAKPFKTNMFGKIGYWSDGEESVAVVTVSASGRRLYFQEGPDQALSTNVAAYLFRFR